MDMTRYGDHEKEIMTEIFRLIEEQTQALASRPCDSVAAQCKKRSAQIQDLVRQVTHSGMGFATRQTSQRGSVQLSPAALAQVPCSPQT